MGWRADLAYDEDERRAYREYLAQLSMADRFFLRLWQAFVISVVAVIIVALFAPNLLASLFSLFS